MQCRNYINEMVIYRHMDTDADQQYDNAVYFYFFFEANFRMRFH